ncbi:MAG: hypothetical protein Kow0031_32900 [Anaerolineae bacterium]
MSSETDRATAKKFNLQRKARVFVSGLKFAIFGDVAVAYKVVLSLVVLGVSFWLREWLDFLLILVVTGVMLITEIFNTTVEALCDYLQPNHDPKIGEIKDIAAAAAGISIFMWLLVLLVEVWEMLRYFGFAPL